MPISFREWLEGVEVEMDSDYGDAKNKRLLTLEKTHKCLQSKLEGVGIPVRFRLVSQTKRASMRGGLRDAATAKDGVITIVRDDSLQHPLTCWMMLHQVGHAMEQSRSGSQAYREADYLIRKWWGVYHEYILREYNDYDDNDSKPLPPKPRPASTPQPPSPPPEKQVVPPVDFGDPAHRKQFRDKMKQGGENYMSYLHRNPAMAHMVFSKFLAFKSARDSWKSFRQTFHQGYHMALDRVAQFGSSGARAAFSADDELMNELVAEYLWHGRIRYVDDPKDPFVQKHPEYIPDMIKKIEGLISKGLKSMLGEVVTVG